MDSKTFSILTFLVFLQCELVFSGWFSKSRGRTYPVSDFVKQLRQEPDDSNAEMHLEYLSMVSSYGGRLYDLSANVSAECQKTLRAGALLVGKLAVGEEANDESEKASAALWKDLYNGSIPEEHPAELFCRKLEKQYAEKPDLSSWFEKAKKDAAESATVVSRRPYSRIILTTNELLNKMAEKWNVPELAKQMAHSSFLDLLDSDNEMKRHVILAKACQAVAKKEQFEKAIQGAYEKAISDVLPELAVADRAKRFKAFLEDEKVTELWWVPKMMKGLYGHISEDPILKKEVDNTAAVIGKGASPVVLDFTKL